MTAPNEDKLIELRSGVAKAGFVDYDKLGAVVAQVAPQLAQIDTGTGEVASDYMITAYTSVLSVWEVHGDTLRLEELTGLRTMVQGLGR
jgi:hypothetical protein